MATKRRDRKKATPRDEIVFTPDDDEVVFIPEGDDEDAAVAPGLNPIEARVAMDSIEYQEEDEEAPRKEPTCIVSFHAELPEHIAQYLFANLVQEGRITVEFQPSAPERRGRDKLVRR